MTKTATNLYISQPNDNKTFHNDFDYCYSEKTKDLALILFNLSRNFILNQKYLATICDGHHFFLEKDKTYIFDFAKYEPSCSFYDLNSDFIGGVYPLKSFTRFQDEQKIDGIDYGLYLTKEKISEWYKIVSLVNIESLS